MGKHGENITRRLLAVIPALALALIFCMEGAATQAQEKAKEPMPAGKDLAILQSFSGDYPVAGLAQLPSGQEGQQAGYLGSPEEFTRVWRMMFPSLPVPEIDFTKNLVVFFRNVQFYNRTSIMKVVLKNGGAEILARETMSSLPIEEKVAMALAVVPREGIRFIRTASGMTPVGQGTPVSPLDASYRIEGREVRLVHGRAEDAAPGSASKSTTTVFGRPVFGDLDNDGNDDAALILAVDSPGSGTFYYIAASLVVNGQFRGTNAVLLGDRIAPRDVRVLKGAVVVDYADRKPEDAMTVPPSVGTTKRLGVRQGILEELAPSCP